MQLNCPACGAMAWNYPDGRKTCSRCEWEEKLAPAQGTAAIESLRKVQSGVHLLRKAIHARDPMQELDLRCHDLWTEIENMIAAPAPAQSPAVTNEEAEIDAWIASIGRITPEIRQRILDAVARYDKCKNDRPLIYTMHHNDPLTVGDLRSIAIALSSQSVTPALPQTEADALRRTLQLHAGDVQSLSGEVEMWRERALEAEEELARLRNAPQAALCNCRNIGDCDGSCQCPQPVTADEPQAAPQPGKLAENQIMQVIRKVTTGDLRKMLTCKRWKDGIDIDQPAYAAERLAEEFRAAVALSRPHQP